jgi:signal transduction histidine kinase
MNDTATAHELDPARPALIPPRPRTALKAIATLRLLLIGSILVPLLVGCLAAYFSYRENYRRAALALSEVVNTAEENTTKILDTHLLVAARIDDLLAGLTDDQIAARESELHQQIARQIAGLPQVAAAWVVGKNGRELVSARVYPVNRDLDQSVRADFQTLRDTNAVSFISALRARSLEGGDYRPYFTISRRLQGPDSDFRGIVVVAVSGVYFGSFYSSLLGAPDDYSASLLKDDGTVLATYPAAADSAKPPQPDPRLVQALAGRQPAGLIESGSPLEGTGELVAYRRLADYPVYVAIAQSGTAIRADWLGSMVGYVAVGVPATICLILLSLLALRRTRLEQTALATARDETARRAALEARLHHAQKLEAVGQLTAGIAHDFNNLLTIISGNISQAQASITNQNARQFRRLEAALSGCERAAALTKRVLGFARRDDAAPQAVDANDVIASTLELPWRAGAAILTELRLQSDLWPVFLDTDQFGNALLNLAVNAQDAMSGGGKLTIQSANCRVDPEAAEKVGCPPGDYVGIFVSDTGHGMPAEIRNKAFDAFFTTKAPGKGTGLGLSQVHGFCARLGGGCMIESDPGRGTTVRLYLPRHGMDRDDAAAPSLDGAILQAVAEPEADPPPRPE